MIRYHPTVNFLTILTSIGIIGWGGDQWLETQLGSFNTAPDYGEIVLEDPVRNMAPGGLLRPHFEARGQGRKLTPDRLLEE